MVRAVWAVRVAWLVRVVPVGPVVGVGRVVTVVRIRPVVSVVWVALSSDTSAYFLGTETGCRTPRRPLPEHLETSETGCRGTSETGCRGTSEVGHFTR